MGGNTTSRPMCAHQETVFALVGGEGGMAKLCARLVDAGLGAVRVSVGERLSYPDEKITCGTAAELASREFDKLSVALIENPAPDAVVTHGCPTRYFCGRWIRRTLCR